MMEDFEERLEKQQILKDVRDKADNEYESYSWNLANAVYEHDKNLQRLIDNKLVGFSFYDGGWLNDHYENIG